MLLANFTNLTLSNFESKQSVLRTFHSNLPFQVHAKGFFEDIIRGNTAMYLAKKTKYTRLPSANLHEWARDMLERDSLTIKFYTEHDFEYYATNEEEYMWVPEEVVQIIKDQPNKFLASELDKWEG